MEIVTAQALAQDLKALGVKQGDMLYVHTSLKSIGWLENGPQTLIQALQDVIGPTGTIAVPTHAAAFVDLGTPPFDPDNTPTGVGLFPETLRCYTGALRSRNASHSTAALGAKAAFLTQSHDPTNPMAEDSPLRRLVNNGGRILLIGVGHNRNTALHMAESMSGLPYVKLPYRASNGNELWMKEADGTVSRHIQTEYPGCSNNFGKIEPEFVAAGIQKIGQIGNAQTRLLEAKPMVELTIKALHRQPDLLLCDNPDCPCCPARRSLLNDCFKNA